MHAFPDLIFHLCAEKMQKQSVSRVNNANDITNLVPISALCNVNLIYLQYLIALKYDIVSGISFIQINWRLQENEFMDISWKSNMCAQILNSNEPK